MSAIPIAFSCSCWAADNGQAAILVVLPEAEAAQLNALSPGLLQRYT